MHTRHYFLLFIALLLSQACNPPVTSDKASMPVTADSAESANDAASEIAQNFDALNQLAYTVDEDQVLSSTLLVPDLENLNINFSIIEKPSNGSLDLKTGGIFTYTPIGNFNGSDTFTFQASLGEFVSESLTAKITVTPVNDPPSLSNISRGTFENSAFQFSQSALLASATDVDGDSLQFVRLETAETVATVTEHAPGVYKYDPETFFDFLPLGNTDSDTLKYVISDGQVEVTGTYIVNITGQNDLPVPSTMYVSVTEDTNELVFSPTATNIVDPDGDTVSITFISVIGTGTIDQVNGTTLRFKPNQEFESLGTSEFSTQPMTYVVSDGKGGLATGDIEIKVIGVNDAPYFSGTPITDGCLDGQTLNTAMEYFDPEFDPITVYTTQDCGFASIGAANNIEGTCGEISPACTVSVAFTDGTDTTVSPIVTIYDNTVRYVAEIATGRKDGSGWNHATNAVAAAVAEVNAGSPNQVWLKKGTYTAPDNNLFIQLTGGTTLYGSFAGTETHVSQRSIDARSTVLSGDANGDGISSVGDAATVLQVNNTSNFIIDGLTIQHGHSTGNSNPGGLLCYSVSNAVFRNLVIRENESSAFATPGGAKLSGCGSLFENIRFESNVGHVAGGALLSGTPVEFRNVGFVNNTKTAATSDGAVLIAVAGTLNAHHVYATQQNVNAGRTFTFVNSTVNIYQSSFGLKAGNFQKSGGTVNIYNSSLDQGGFLMGGINSSDSCQSSSTEINEVASGEVFLNSNSTCKNLGDNATADTTYTLLDSDWRNLTTQKDEPPVLDGALGDNVDPAYHHDPARVWIESLSNTGLAVNWTTNENAQNCQITNNQNDNVYSIPANLLPAGNYHPFFSGFTSGTKVTMTCSDPNGPWSAQASIVLP